MKIQGNKILYDTHAVVCDPSVASVSYMESMADSLDPNGTAGEHMDELEAMNNDGAWSVEKL